MYNGGKNGEGVMQCIINQFPAHDIYIEVCAGSGAIIRNKVAARQNIAIELDAAAIAKYDYGAGVTVVNADALQWLRKQPWLFMQADKRVLVYADPPYPRFIRRSSKDLYKYEWTDEQHKEFLRLACSMKVAIVISTYANDMYDELLPGWRKVYFPGTSHVGKTWECLYCNFQEPEELHQYNYLGDNFRERQRIRDKIKRHVSRLMQLPARERNAILNALQNNSPWILSAENNMPGTIYKNGGGAPIVKNEVSGQFVTSGSNR